MNTCKLSGITGFSPSMAGDDVCPKCGAERSDERCVRVAADDTELPEYECGTYVESDGTVIQGDNCLLAERDALLAENARLQAIVDKLPKTADGVTILPGQRLWYFTRLHPEALWIDVDHWGEDHAGTVVWGESQHEPMDSLGAEICYSTREAAEAATNS